MQKITVKKPVVRANNITTLPGTGTKKSNDKGFKKINRLDAVVRPAVVRPPTPPAVPRPPPRATVKKKQPLLKKIAIPERVVPTPAITAPAATPAPVESNPAPAAAPLVIQPDIEALSPFKLVLDDTVRQVLEFEIKQRDEDTLMDEEPVYSRTQTKNYRIDPTTGMVINIKSKSFRKAHVQNAHQTSALRMPVFRGIPDAPIITGAPDIKIVNFDDIPAFCLHLSDRTDRESFMLDNLPKFHSNVQWLEGVRMTPGYKGIARAHKRIIAIAKAKGWPYVITFEDDIKIPSAKSKAAFISAMKTLPADWDALLGGVYDCKSHKLISDGLAEVRGWCSLHCVLWRHTIYDDILNHHEKSHIDRYIGGLPNRKFYMTWPFVAVQYNGFSDNVSQNVNYDNYLARYKILV